MISVYSLQIRPLAFFGLANMLTIIALHAPIRTRKYLLFPICATTIISVASLNGIETFDFYMAVLVLTHLCRSPLILLVEECTLIEGEKQWAPFRGRESILTTYKIWYDPRGLNTKRLKQQTAMPITRLDLAKFTLQRAVQIAILWIINIYLIEQAFSYMFSKGTLEDLAPEKEPIFRRIHNVTGEEVCFRSAMSVYWIWSAYYILSCCHHILAIVFCTILRFDHPDEWPPLFGVFFEAYTIKRFWGTFWHRLTPPTFGAWAQLFATKCLGLKTGSEATKHSIAFFIFAMSGLIHSLVGFIMHQTALQRDFTFFCKNYVAIVIEIALQRYIEHLRATSITCLPTFPRFMTLMLLKFLGFTWVFAFFFWSVPRWQYPKAHHALEMAIVKKLGETKRGPF